MTTDVAEHLEENATVVPCSLTEYCAYFLRLGIFGFGGPIALAGYMQKDLVEELCGATLLLISKVKKAPEPLVILAAGVVGLTLRTVAGN